VTLSTADSGSAIQAALDNPAYQRIAFAAGDYSDKAASFNLNRNGTSQQRLWLMLAGGQATHPYGLASGSRAYLPPIEMQAADWWVLRRLAFKKNTLSSGIPAIRLGDPADQNSAIIANDNVLDSLYVHSTTRTDGPHSGIYFGGEALHARNTIQHCLLGPGTQGSETNETRALGPHASIDTHLVNSEVFDWHKCVGTGAGVTTTPGLVIENCDIYYSNNWRTDGAGNYDPNGNYCLGEALLSFKAGGTSVNPMRLTHNRLWGALYTEPFIGSGGSSFAIGLSAQANGGSRYVVVQNNVVMECQVGIGGYWESVPDAHISFIGNIVTRCRNIVGGADKERWVFFLRGKARSEIYLNSFIDNDPSGGSGTDPLFDVDGFGNQNLDVLGNVWINNAGSFRIAETAGLVFDWNAFYGGAQYTFGGGGNNKYMPIPNWSAAAAKQIGDCIKDPISGSILIARQVTGQTGSSAPLAPALGLFVQDAGVLWQTIRSKYVLKRRLITTLGVGEDYGINYARVHGSAPEAGWIPGGQTSGAIGSRADIGVGADVLPLGIMGKDMREVAR
jgi:hypothetical protein